MELISQNNRNVGSKKYQLHGCEVFFATKEHCSLFMKNNVSDSWSAFSTFSVSEQRRGFTQEIRFSQNTTYCSDRTMSTSSNSFAFILTTLVLLRFFGGGVGGLGG